MNGARGGALRPQLHGGFPADRLFIDKLQDAPKFPVASVKNPHLVAGGAAQHMAQVMRLIVAKGDGGPCGQFDIDIEARQFYKVFHDRR